MSAEKQNCSSLCRPATPAVVEYLNQYAIHGLSIHTDRLYPYSKPGWFDVASAWTVKVLSQSGYENESIHQARTGSQGSMLVAKSQCGSRFFMKAVQPGGLNHQASVTLGLSQVMPDKFMRPLAVDIANNYLVMNDYGPTLPDDADLANSNLELFRRVLATWGKIQICSLPKKKQLQEMGLPKMNRSEWGRRIKQMLGDPEWRAAQEHGLARMGKSEHKISYEKMYLIHVDTVLRKIEEYRVPLALVHGDLNPVNVIHGKGSKLVFIDFAFTCWGFPFMDALQFAVSCGAEMKDLDFYLELWSGYESMKRLRELFALVDSLDLICRRVLAYELFINAEESCRRDLRQDMESPVYRDCTN